MILKKLKIFFIIVCLTLLYYSLPVYGDDVPARLSFQGRLADSNGDPITATGAITFKIYDETGGVELWTETQPSVSISNGIFNVNLGDVAPIPAGLFPGATRYIEIGYGGETLSPKIMLVSNGYAFCADTLDGKEYAHFVTTATVQTIEGVKTFTDDIQFASMTVSGQIAFADGTTMTSTTPFSGGGSEWNDVTISTLNMNSSYIENITRLKNTSAGNNIDVDLQGVGSLHIAYDDNDGSKVFIGDGATGDVDLQVSGEVTGGTVTVVHAITAPEITIADKLYLNTTNQYIYVAGSDLTLMDTEANWMRFSNGGNTFAWFNDGTTMTETIMTLDQWGNISVDGFVKVGNNEIKDSDDGIRLLLSNSFLTINSSVCLATQGLTEVKTYSKAGQGVIHHYQNSTDTPDYKRYLDIVSGGGDRVSAIRFINQIVTDNDPTETMRIDSTGNVGISSAAPSYLLTMEDGNGGGYYDASDHDWHTGASLKEFKKDVKDYKIEDIQEILNGIRIRQFRWKDSDKLDVHYIAEEIPEALKPLLIDETGRTTAKKVFAFCVLVMQEQQFLMQKQQEEIEKLRNEIFNIKNRDEEK